jgi:AmmeMemoRadiSam system protein B
MEKPKIRDTILAEPWGQSEDGEPVFRIRDHLIFKGPGLGVGRLHILLLQMFDGTRSVSDVQAELTQALGGQLFPGDVLEDFVEALDECLFLDNENFARAFDEMMSELRSSPRAPICAGRSYSDEPEILQEQIASYFEHPDGPGLPNGDANGKPIKAIVAPHIDYDRGGFSYAHAYRQLQESPPIDLFIILGTGHDGPRGEFVFSQQDFETPLGIVETDRDFIQRLQARVAQDLCEEEFLHVDEHSIELQLVFLQNTYGVENCPKIVPILCGGFHLAMMEGTVPTDDPPIAAFIDALRETIGESDQSICVMASADLSHVGPHFGDHDVEVSEDYLSEIGSEDLELLEVALKLDANDFFRHILQEKNKRRICGLASIYTMLSVIDPVEAKLLNYGQTNQPTGDLAVTFCSMTFR